MFNFFFLNITTAVSLLNIPFYGNHCFKEGIAVMQYKGNGRDRRAFDSSSWTESLERFLDFSLALYSSDSSQTAAGV